MTVVCSFREALRKLGEERQESQVYDITWNLLSEPKEHGVPSTVHSTSGKIDVSF